MKINKDVVEINNKSFELEDIPGHASIRKNQLDFKDVKFVIFMVDSFEVMSNLDSLADYLYEVVNEVKGRVPIVIVFNKIEISLYKKEQMMKQIIGEIQKKDKGFEFGHNVQIVSVSLKKEDAIQTITNLLN
jgi:RNAse (barnase) inhibitor barstar